MKACITSTYPGSGDDLEQLLTYLSKRDIYKVNVEASTLHPALSSNLGSLSRTYEVDPRTPAAAERDAVSEAGNSPPASENVVLPGRTSST